jgi:hypothetical protein
VVRVEARARYLDTEGGVHESVGGTSFDLFGPLRVFKYADDEIRFGEESYVHLSVSNGGDRSLVVALTDSAGRDFKTDSSLEWKMTIPPGESRTASYTVDAKKPGDGQTLPPAEATYSVDGTIYKVKSSSPVVDVIGPLVEVGQRCILRQSQAGGDGDGDGDRKERREPEDESLSEGDRPGMGDPRRGGDGDQPSPLARGGGDRLHHILPGSG